MGLHSVTCYPTQVNTLRLNPSHAGRYSIYLPRKDGRLSWPSWLDSAPAGSRTSDLSIMSPTLNQCSHQGSMLSVSVCVFTVLIEALIICCGSGICSVKMCHSRDSVRWRFSAQRRSRNSSMMSGLSRCWSSQGQARDWCIRNIHRGIRECDAFECNAAGFQWSSYTSQSGFSQLLQLWSSHCLLKLLMVQSRRAWTTATHCYTASLTD